MKTWMIFLFLILRGYAHAAGISPYEWVKDRQRYVLSELERSYPEYILKMHRQYDYEWEGDNLITYVTDHRITHGEEEMLSFSTFTKTSTAFSVSLSSVRARIL